MSDTAAQGRRSAAMVPTLLRCRWPLIAATLILVSVVAAAPAGTAAAAAAGTATGANTTVLQSNSSRPMEISRSDWVAGTEPGSYHMADHDDRFWGGRWWIVVPIMMVVFWGGVIAVAVWGIRQFSGGRDRAPLDIARERLAKGEISKEEFDRIRDDLA